MSGRLRRFLPALSALLVATAGTLTSIPGSAAEPPPAKATVTDLAGPGEFLEAGDVAVARTGRAVAIWEDQGRILVARRPPGGSWGARVVLDASGKARSPQVEDVRQGALPGRLGRRGSPERRERTHPREGAGEPGRRVGPRGGGGLPGEGSVP
ncbi:MAG: hypothetical protein R2731_03290 [Nocardioides sp.]